MRRDGGEERGWMEERERQCSVSGKLFEQLNNNAGLRWQHNAKTAKTRRLGGHVRQTEAKRGRHKNSPAAATSSASRAQPTTSVVFMVWWWERLVVVGVGVGSRVSGRGGRQWRTTPNKASIGGKQQYNTANCVAHCPSRHSSTQPAGGSWPAFHHQFA